MAELTYQTRFINILKDHVPANISLANEISSLLGLSLDSTYRRLRCETDLTLNEVVKLCHHFDIPLEALNNEMPSVVTFKFSNRLEDEASFAQYLQNILTDLETMNRFENKRMYYASEDIPMFHQFSQTSLSAFKIFYWLKSILNIPEFQSLPYKSDFVKPGLLQAGAAIYKNYLQIPSVEIWTEETMLSTIKQIHFYWDAGFFQSAAQATEVIDDLTRMIQHIQKQAEVGKKINSAGSVTPVDYVFYLSDLMIGTNNILVKTESKFTTYISYNSFNSMGTGNRFFNEQNERWMNNLLSKATLLSGVAEKQRNQFFKGLYKKIEQLREHIVTRN
ncbi:MAG: hypothetical protein K1X81_12110 [Bacteroidia bacterium]|nr:hypothetical protein [Bacteroidia bacterium]